MGRAARPRARWVWVALFAFCLQTLTVNGAEPTELLQLIGEDAGLCVQLYDWKSQREQLLGSELARRVHNSRLFQEWLSSSDATNLKKGIANVEKALGQPLLTLLDDLFGQHAVLAVYPNSGNEESKKPVGVLLTQSNSVESLQKILSAWEGADPQPQEQRKHQDIPYKIRNPGAKQICLLTLGRVLAVSDNEAAIQKIIEYSTSIGSPNSGRLPDTEAFRASRQDLNPATGIEVFLNPRAWDAVLKIDEQGQAQAGGKPAQDRSEDDKAARMFAKVWKQLQSVRVGVRVSPQLVGEAVVQTRTPRSFPFPPPATQLSETLQHLPGNALAIWEGTTDFAWLAQRLSKLADGKGKGVQDLVKARGMIRGLLLGQDLLTDVLPQFGPPFAACAVPRNPPTEGIFPIDGFVVVGLRERENAEDPSLLRNGLDNALNTSLNLIAAVYNNQPREQEAVVRTNDTLGEQVRLRWIKHLGRYHPGYLISSSHLMLTGSPALAHAFLSQSPESSAAAIPMLRKAQSQYFTKYQQLLFVNTKAIRELLVGQREDITQQAMQAHSLTEAEAGQKLDKVIELTNLLDGAFLAVHVEPSAVRIVGGGLTDEQQTLPP